MARGRPTPRCRCAGMQPLHHQLVGCAPEWRPCWAVATSALQDCRQLSAQSTFVDCLRDTLGHGCFHQPTESVSRLVGGVQRLSCLENGCCIVCAASNVVGDRRWHQIQQLLSCLNSPSGPGCSLAVTEHTSAPQSNVTHELGSFWYNRGKNAPLELGQHLGVLAPFCGVQHRCSQHRSGADGWQGGVDGLEHVQPGGPCRPLQGMPLLMYLSSCTTRARLCGMGDGGPGILVRVADRNCIH
jgi:hypothetical protein